ncbi:class I adenylate-forming enzyme family protein [Trujillonella endophytica]|uniref:Fatty-acyl-CoA synthase n=1 Tax=Trujillonella endophytica TaxID=673521 RepID=A0A1H8VS02_9ACTN|nr:class I adenylate-forming enzyme family protein [Trujillella endophytica]SEP18135.1 fatty-acyl-CoA synthase [Trujillella endophytica]
MRAAVAAGGTSVPLLECTIGDRLRETAARFPDRPALLWAEGDGLGRMTYAELLAEAQRVAGWIARRTAPGDRVAIWSRNSVEWVLAEYGCALSGTVVTAWNGAWTDPECAHAVDGTDPRLVLAGRDVRGVDLLDRARSLGARGRVHDLSALRALAGSEPPAALPPVAPDDLFLLQFTSGTTGRPKAAALSHRAALNGAWIRARLHGTDEHDVLHNPVPMTHVGGALAMVLGAMAVGSAYVLMPRFDEAEYLRLLRLTGATRLGGVPTMLLRLLDHPDWVPPPAGQVRSTGLGGSSISPRLVERLRAEIRAPVFATYGQSECLMVSSTRLDDDPAVVTDTVGRVVPHVELSIRDPLSGRQLAVGEAGEICVRTVCAAGGYFGAPEASAQAFTPDGFLRTGDLGSLDEQGFLRVQGRVRDVVIRGGENVYPAEVEEVLGQHPAVAAVAVVGVPDERWGQQVGAAVVLREGADPAPRALEAFAAERLAHFKVPRVWRFEATLPVTAVGKVRKVEVEELFRAGGG